MKELALPKVKKQRRKGRPKKVSAHTTEELVVMQTVLKARCKEMGWPVNEVTLRRAKAAHLSNNAGREIEKYGFDADLYDCVKSIHKIFKMHRQLCEATTPSLDSCSGYVPDQIYVDPDAKNYEPLTESQKTAQYRSISEERDRLIYAISMIAGQYSSRLIDVIVDDVKPFPEFMPILIALHHFLIEIKEDFN